jgi:glutathione S-transferase
MAIEVFWSSGSSYAWRVLLTLEIKRIEYESRLISTSKGENRTPEFLAMNPRGRVPVMRDGDLVLYESLAIVEYLDRQYPEPPLYGRTPREAGKIAQRVNEYSSYLDPHVENFILPLYRGTAPEHADEVVASAVALHAELPFWEGLLGTDPWICGDEPTAADVVFYPAVRSILRAASKDKDDVFEFGFLPLDGRYPAIVRWMDRVEALPGFERTEPPHWKSTPPVA